VPLIDGVGERTVDRTISAGGLRLVYLRAFALDGGTPEREAQLRNLARLVLRNVSLPYLRRSMACDGPVELRLFSHPAAGATGRADLVLDWSALFSTRDASLWPDRADWSSRLIPALADVRELIGSSQTAHLHIAGNYHLAAAYALGHQFVSTTTISLAVISPSGVT